MFLLEIEGLDFLGREASRLDIFTGAFFPASVDWGGRRRFAGIFLPEALADAVDKEQAAIPSKGLQYAGKDANGAQGKEIAAVVLSWYSSRDQDRFAKIYH